MFLFIAAISAVMIKLYEKQKRNQPVISSLINTTGTDHNTLHPAVQENTIQTIADVYKDKWMKAVTDDKDNIITFLQIFCLWSFNWVQWQIWVKEMGHAWLAVEKRAQTWTGVIT